MRKMYKMVQQLEIESATSLGQMGPAAAERLPQLIEALVDGPKWMRIDAADALGKIGPAAAAAVPRWRIKMKTCAASPQRPWAG